ncbi:pectinesterase inhibitor 9-like [Zingiber officinale]|uniref:Pectinesterase inhibitor domain-containing protein n=1 Tax=Zingiber officinale TaxID=94328 RepID=A0A8J5INF4_ZINOF|nr:pectinesterase inhibitor 9-like [Zingiber officinale]KAG6538700.1 hypothetical protein ZIOFF_003828 [Zingiber officinale]
MERRILALVLVLVASVAICASASSAPAVGHRASAFIRSSCRATRYPNLCERSLSTYAPPVRRSPRGVAVAALSVSAAKARSASAFVSRMCGGKPTSGRTREAGAVKDCLETMRDSVDRLRHSIREIGRMGPARSLRFSWHLSNVQTWVSAALTDQSTCLDSVSQNAGPTVRAAIRKRVVEVAQVTSNALALVNRLQPRT